MQEIIREIENTINGKIKALNRIDYNIFKNEFYIGQLETSEDFIYCEDTIYIYTKNKNIYNNILQGKLKDKDINDYFTSYTI